MLSDDAPGLFGQEYHHVYWGAMFLLFHQAEITPKKHKWRWKAQFMLLVKISQVSICHSISLNDQAKAKQNVG